MFYMTERLPNGNLMFRFCRDTTEIISYTSKITKEDYDFVMNLVGSYDKDFYTFFIETPEEYPLKIQLYKDYIGDNILFLKTQDLALITKDSAAVRKIDRIQAIIYLDTYLKMLIK